MIIISGGTGFVGLNLVKTLLKKGAEVRCIARDPSSGRAKTLTALGAEVVAGDIRDRASLLKAVHGAERAVSLVGILEESKKATFTDIHRDGLHNYIEACKEQGVKDFFHLSSLGTRPDGKSRYHQTKWAGEELIRASGLRYTIFRSSVIFGREDKFINLFAKIIRFSPVINLPGNGKNLMQPVSVHDLTAAMAEAVMGERFRGETFEAAGPEKLTFDEIIDTICRVLRKKRVKLHIPVKMMVPAALALELLPLPPLITRDQLIMVREDNVTDENALTDVFKMELTKLEEGIREYLTV